MVKTPTVVRHLLELIRFSHTVFALPFALLAAVMAWTIPIVGPGGSLTQLSFSWRTLVGILLCMVFARSAAMAFNRWLDRDLDAANPRTARRHIPAGLLSARTVALFTIGCCLAFQASTFLFWPNWLPAVLAIPVLLWLLGYSFAKRFTSLAHFWLGVALMMAPIATWIALRGTAVLASPGDLLPAVWLGLAVLLWVAGFDIIYACQDYAYDVQAKLHSVPAKLGIRGALRAAALCHATMLGVLVSLPFVGHWGGPPIDLGLVYGTGVAAITALLLYEHLLVRPDDLSRVNLAFFHVNAIVSIGLFCVTTLDLIVV